MKKIGVTHVLAALSVRDELFMFYIEFYGQNPRDDVYKHILSGAVQ